MIWESRADFERYWFSEEVGARPRSRSLGWYDIPLLPEWHTLVGGEAYAG